MTELPYGMQIYQIRDLAGKCVPDGKLWFVPLSDWFGTRLVLIDRVSTMNVGNVKGLALKRPFTCYQGDVSLFNRNELDVVMEIDKPDDFIVTSS